jgi:hypothetical protein
MPVGSPDREEAHDWLNPESSDLVLAAAILAITAPHAHGETLLRGEQFGWKSTLGWAIRPARLATPANPWQPA